MKRALALAAAFALLVGWMLLCVRLVVFDHSFYINLYKRISLTQRVDVSSEDLQDAIFLMTDYVQGKRDDLDGTVVWNGQTQETFNEKEKSHMKDVRSLYQKAMMVMYACFVLAALCLGALFLMARKLWKAYFARGFFLALAGFAVLLVFFGFWAVIDFSGLWTQFHHVFFTNDLWLLNPATDFMIVICPEEMFSSMIFKIAFCFVFGLCVMALFAWDWMKKAPIGFEKS